MNIRHKHIVSIFILVGLFSCKTNLEIKPISHGSADFSRYVAIGNSLTSGFSDGALIREGQENSFPHLLFKQFSMVDGGTFKIPYLPENGGGNDGQGHPRLVLGYVLNCGSKDPSLGPVSDPKGVTELSNVSAQGPYNLIGVPGARAIDVASGAYGLFNQYLGRFATTPGVSSMLSEALRSNPTFFTFWLGSNDVLLYATGGAVAPVGPFDPTLSDTAMVRMSIMSAIDSLTKTGAKGAIANIPDMTFLPYFTTVPWNSIVLRQGQADTLNAIYAPLGITWNAGPNGIMIADDSAPAKMRHAQDHDLILLTTPSDSIRCAEWGVNPYKPLADKYVLDKDEAAQIQAYTHIYNQSILDIAHKYDLAFVDMNLYLKSFKSGIIYNGISLNANYVSGGAFSLDGVHPNQRGYALIANEFIRAINAKFGSTIPMVDPTQAKGIEFP